MLPLLKSDRVHRRRTKALAHSRVSRFEPLEDRRMLAIDAAFEDGLLTVTADADEEIVVKASGDSTQILGRDSTSSEYSTADITQLKIATSDTTATIDVGEVTAERFPNIREAVF